MFNAYNRALGEALAQERTAAGLSKKRLSLMVGVSRPTIRKIERGGTNPSLDVLLRITQGLGVSLADIIVEAERSLLGQSESRPTQGPTAITTSKKREEYFLTHF